MDLLPWLSLLIIAIAVGSVTRGLDVRLALFAAALVIGGLSSDLKPIVRTFLGTFSSEKFVVPICTAMGFAYVLKHTQCDQQLVRLLVAPLKHVRFLMIPGIVVVGFIVNIPVVSQTSTAVCLGTVVVPLMRAAGFSPLQIGSTLLLGCSVGGELLNPGAPELLTVKDLTGTPTPTLTQTYLAPIVLLMLGCSTILFWLQSLRMERRATESTTPITEPLPGRINLLQALVPLVPLVLLFLSGPPFEFLKIPKDWLIVGSKDVPYPEKLASSRLVGLAMIVGVVVAALAAPRKSAGCMRAFFDGAGYGFANIISLIVIANCLGKAIEGAGLARLLGDLIGAVPKLLTPLAAFVPMLFGFVCGSGMASTQSLYGFFFKALYPEGGPLEPEQTVQADRVGAMVGLGSAAGRTLSPVAAVTLMCAKLTDTTPFGLMARVALPLIGGISVVVLARMLCGI